jgi:hypothetical protein
MHGLTVESSWTALVPGLLLVGIGIGIANPAIAKTALGVVPPPHAGMASGISNTFRIGGLATGVAALGVVFHHHLTTRAPGTTPHAAYVSSINLVFLIGTALVTVGALAAVTLVRSRDFQHATATQRPVAAPQPC